MSAAAIVVEGERYAPIQVSEATLEGLLRTSSADLFPGFQYFDFKPPIPGPLGVRHPDGALVSPGCERWWVVEVELHTHSVEDHIGPQLTGLAEGVYGTEAFRYLERYAHFNPSDYGAVDVWQPAFLLIVDHATPQIRRAADLATFDLVEIEVYRSERSRYALAVSGTRPVAEAIPLPAGVDVQVDQERGIPILKPLGGRGLPPETGAPLMIGERQVRQLRTSDGRAIALPLTREELTEEIGVRERYRLTMDDRLIPIDPQ